MIIALGRDSAPAAESARRGRRAGAGSWADRSGFAGRWRPEVRRHAEVSSIAVMAAPRKRAGQERRQLGAGTREVGLPGVVSVVARVPSSAR
jgi:hypothetical protein